MSERPPLSKGELDVARMVWEVGPAGVREIHDAICQTREIVFATVQTYLRRLETKGYVSSKKEGGMRIYAARAKPKTVIRQTVDDLVDRLFAGDSMPLVKHLIEDRGIDQEQLVELRELINRMEESGGTS